MSVIEKIIARISGRGSIDALGIQPGQTIEVEPFNDGTRYRVLYVGPDCDGNRIVIPPIDDSNRVIVNRSTGKVRPSQQFGDQLNSDEAYGRRYGPGYRGFVR